VSAESVSRSPPTPKRVVAYLRSIRSAAENYSSSIAHRFSKGPENLLHSSRCKKYAFVLKQSLRKFNAEMVSDLSPSYRRAFEQALKWKKTPTPASFARAANRMQKAHQRAAVLRTPMTLFAEVRFNKQHPRRAEVLKILRSEFNLDWDSIAKVPGAAYSVIVRRIGHSLLSKEARADYAKNRWLNRHGFDRSKASPPELVSKAPIPWKDEPKAPNGARLKWADKGLFSIPKMRTHPLFDPLLIPGCQHWKSKQMSGKAVNIKVGCLPVGLRNECTFVNGYGELEIDRQAAIRWVADTKGKLRAMRIGATYRRLLKKKRGLDKAMFRYLASLFFEGKEISGVEVRKILNSYPEEYRNFWDPERRAAVSRAAVSKWRKERKAKKSRRTGVTTQNTKL